MEGFCFNSRRIRKRAILNPPLLTRFTSVLFNDGSTDRVSHAFTDTYSTNTTVYIFAHIQKHSHTLQSMNKASKDWTDGTFHFQ